MSKTTFSSVCLRHLRLEPVYFPASDSAINRARQKQRSLELEVLNIVNIILSIGYVRYR